MMYVCVYTTILVNEINTTIIQHTITRCLTPLKVVLSLSIQRRISIAEAGVQRMVVISASITIVLEMSESLLKDQTYEIASGPSVS